MAGQVGRHQPYQAQPASDALRLHNHMISSLGRRVVEGLPVNHNGKHVDSWRACRSQPGGGTALTTFMSSSALPPSASATGPSVIPPQPQILALGLCSFPFLWNILSQVSVLIEKIFLPPMCVSDCHPSHSICFLWRTHPHQSSHCVVPCGLNVCLPSLLGKFQSGKSNISFVDIYKAPVPGTAHTT